MKPWQRVTSSAEILRDESTRQSPTEDETMTTKAAIYARVSTLDQEPENQLAELRRYVGARGWAATEYVDHGVSGAKDRRPALDHLLKDARRRRFDVLVVWRLDRLGRNLRHLIVTLEELRALGVDFTSLNEGIDTGTPAGRLQLHLLAAIAEFERERIRERVLAGLARARATGKRLGRPKASAAPSSASSQLTVRHAASVWGVSKSTAHRRLRAGRIPVAGQKTLPTAS
jgi:DNA invertase Pin-like site-specific DNA recombinase